MSASVGTVFSITLHRGKPSPEPRPKWIPIHHNLDSTHVVASVLDANTGDLIAPEEGPFFHFVDVNTLEIRWPFTRDRQDVKVVVVA